MNAKVDSTVHANINSSLNLLKIIFICESHSHECFDCTTIFYLSLTKPANTSDDLTGLKQHDLGEDSQYKILKRNI